jgi:formamidopyrimidine-DNA glycosylase
MFWWVRMFASVWNGIRAGVQGMPELPEVETVRRGLSQQGCDAVVVGVGVFGERVLRGQAVEEFVSRMTGARLGSATRRGKFILVPLSSSVPGADWLCLHFNMRGLLRWASAGDPPERYDRVSLDLADGRSLRFHDVWGWGEVRALSVAERESVPSLSAMGPEPLGESWVWEDLRDRFRGRGTAVKTVLLDQSVVAGVGNIYADESLHRAGIDPRLPAGSLSEPAVIRLVSAVREVLSEAVASGGSAGEYMDLDGNPGRYLPRVYGRAGEPCQCCGAVLERVRLGGRGTTWCPRCQPPAGGADKTHEGIAHPE